ncbi:MAG: hypothetical protein JY451_00200 [Erythrobacter sp.]|nr:MAG: hypothetical protein JY451_00200 [Erythrobacter sp.]
MSVDDTLIVRRLEGEVHRQDLEAAKNYFAGSFANSPSKEFTFTVELPSDAMGWIDVHLFDEIVSQWIAFGHAQKGARSSDAISHAIMLDFFCQLQPQAKAHRIAVGKPES